VGRTYKPSDHSVMELLADWVLIMEELKARGVTRSNNNPTGDLAEKIVAAHYRVELANANKADWDLKTRDGERVQVKGTRATLSGAAKLGAIRGSMGSFDFVVVVIFLAGGFASVEGLKIPPAVIARTGVNNRINGRQITISKKLREDPDVEVIDFGPALARLEWTKALKGN